MTSTPAPVESLRVPPEVSGADGDDGHLQELRTDPIGLLNRVRAECGDVGRFRLADRWVTLLSGAGPNEFFFRAEDELLDQAEAYPFMQPIFGTGVVFDVPPERRREMMHNQALRDKFMRGHAATIHREVTDMVARWSHDGGEIDLLGFFAELTIYTSSSCLIGKKFRDQLDDRFAALYHDLERGTDAYAYVDPYAPIEAFRRRDAARAGLVDLVAGIIDARDGAPVTDADRDLLDVLISIRDDDNKLRFDADQITGMFISMMFAGHHTTSGTAAWTLIELLANPETFAAVVAEQDALRDAADGEELSYQALREMPQLEAAIKEALRLHPPLILLLRVATADVEVNGFHIPAGSLVGATPSVSNRIAADFADPDVFRPQRYLDDPPADAANPWTWIPFGAGRHRCVGAPFAMMQLKAIFSVLLRDWTFALTAPRAAYHDDFSKMVIQLAQPCTARYVRRTSEPAGDAGVAGASR